MLLFIIIESALRQRVYAYQWTDIRAYFGRGGVSEYDASLAKQTLKDADYQYSIIRSFKNKPKRANTVPCLHIAEEQTRQNTESYFHGSRARRESTQQTTKKGWTQ